MNRQWGYRDRAAILWLLPFIALFIFFLVRSNYLGSTITIQKIQRGYMHPVLDRSHRYDLFAVGTPNGLVEPIVKTIRAINNHRFAVPLYLVGNEPLDRNSFGIALPTYSDLHGAIKDLLGRTNNLLSGDSLTGNRQMHLRPWTYDFSFRVQEPDGEFVRRVIVKKIGHPCSLRACQLIGQQSSLRLHLFEGIRRRSSLFSHLTIGSIHGFPLKARIVDSFYQIEKSERRDDYGQPLTREFPQSERATIYRIGTIVGFS